MKSTFACTIVVCLMMGCHSKNEVEFSLQNLVDSINAREAELKKIEVFTPDNPVAYNAVKLYKQYADSFPGEKPAADFLFKAANVCIGLRQYKQAIGFLERIQNHFPEYEKSAESLFLKAFIYDNYLNQKGMAREIYQEVIDQYPSHKFASDAKEVIKTLELTDEELIKMFKEKEEASSGNEVSKK